MRLRVWLRFGTKVLTVFCATALLGTGAVQARSVPDNVKLAEKAMYAAAQMEPTVPSGGNPLKMKKDGSGACEYMNGGPVVVTLHCEAWYRDFTPDKATKKMAIRLVTFGAPRYALSTKFFPSPRNFYVYTVENLYRSGNNWRTDPKVFE